MKSSLPPASLSDTTSAERVSTDRRGRRWHWMLVVAVIVSVLAGGAGWGYLRNTERTRVLAAIEAAGGKWHRPPGPSYFDRVLASMFGASAEDRRYDVWITGAEVDDAWLSANGDLR